MYKHLSGLGFGGIMLITACTSQQTVPTTGTPVKVEVRKGFNDYTPVARQAPRKQSVDSVSFSPITGPVQNQTPIQNKSSSLQEAEQSNSFLPATTSAGSDILGLQVQKDFDYSSTQDVHLVLSVKNPNSQPYQNVPFSVFSENQEKPLLRGVTNTEGRFEQDLRLPAHHQTLQIQIAALGIHNNASLPIQSGQVEANFGPQSTSSSY